ncbi:MAG: aldo/keto reductase [Burkholderiaceae bacterium]|nr:aldo/keto reductase [Burkholderiaceae bacterium]
MKTRRIAGFQVAEIGLGCMNLSHAYGTPVSAEQGERVLLAALDAGVTLIDTAALYGFGGNEKLVGRVLGPHRQRIVLCSKGGMTGQPVGPNGALQRVIDGSPASLRRDVEASLQRLGTEVIDLYYLHRWHKQVPIEDSVGELARLQAEGKIRALGLSEVSTATLRRAHAVAPIAALQSEYSLWSRNAELGTLAACAELGIAYVAFSPLARAFLTNALRDVSGFDAKDIRRAMPRFTPGNYAANLQLLDAMLPLAAEAGCTPAQLALAWLLQRGEQVIPIPGTTSVEHLHENLGASGVVLAPDLVARLEALFAPQAVHGHRYNTANQTEVDTEDFSAGAASAGG